MLESDIVLLQKWARSMIDGSITGDKKIGFYVQLFHDQERSFDSQRSARLAIMAESDFDEHELFRLYLLLFAPEKL